MDILKNIRMGLIFNLILFELIIWGTTGSPNPLGFFEIENLSIKIVLVILMIFLTLHGLLHAALVGIPEDVDCQDPDCGKGIRTFFFVMYKGALKCPQCGRWYHRLCWTRYNKTDLTPWGIAKGCKKCKEEREIRSSWLAPAWEFRNSGNS